MNSQRTTCLAFILILIKIKACPKGKKRKTSTWASEIVEGLSQSDLWITGHVIQTQSCSNSPNSHLVLHLPGAKNSCQAASVPIIHPSRHKRTCPVWARNSKYRASRIKFNTWIGSSAWWFMTCGVQLPRYNSDRSSRWKASNKCSVKTSDKFQILLHGPILIGVRLSIDPPLIKS